MPSSTASVQVRAWDAGGGATFEAAFAAGNKTGQSKDLSVVTGGFGLPPSAPATLVGLESFALTLPATFPVPGDKLWEFNAGFGLSISPAIGADGTIYFGTGAEQQVSGKLYALNPDGTTKWTIDLAVQPISTAPAIGPDGTIYVGSEHGRLFAFEDEGTNGYIKWPPFTNSSSKPIYSSPAIGTDGTVYFAATPDRPYDPGASVTCRRSRC